LRQLLKKLPDNFDASEQLFDPRYERFAHLRVIGVPCAIAAIEAGFVGKVGKPMNGGNAARLDRHPQIVARKVFLAHHRLALAPRHHPFPSVTATRAGLRQPRLARQARISVCTDTGALLAILPPGFPEDAADNLLCIRDEVEAKARRSSDRHDRCRCPLCATRRHE
jgi:hypothetical protein